MKAKPRILLYSHDTYGLGHLRRSLAIAGQIAADIPQTHQLLVTGSIVAGAFELPPRLDLIKLPALSKRSSGVYKSRTLPLTLRQTLAWREQMILQAATNFKPDLILVDKVAAGVKGELLPTLNYLKTWLPDTKLVLGMRDIEDSPEATRAEWQRGGTAHLLEEVYDSVLLYGERRLFDPVSAYNMSPRAAAKLVECGYLQRAEAARPAGSIRGELGLGQQPLVLVTVGGGGDGHDIIKVYLEMVAGLANQAGESRGVPFHSLIVTGPLMARKKHVALQQMARGLPVSLLSFTPDLGSYLAAADLVVSMAGYNTVCEILSRGKRALLIPRAHTRAEQRIRAMSLAERGLVRMLSPQHVTPDLLAEAVDAALDGLPPAVDLAMDGLSQTSQAIARLLDGRRPAGAYAPFFYPQSQPMEVTVQ
jgi:predicted glycosyltransferase